MTKLELLKYISEAEECGTDAEITLNDVREILLSDVISKYKKSPVAWRHTRAFLESR